MFIYPVLFFASFFLSWFLIPQAERFSSRYHLYDHPEADGLKIHRKPISFLGGGAMLIAFLVILSLGWVAFGLEFSKISGIIFLTMLFWFLGFLDDLKWSQRTKRNIELKFLSQIGAALAVVLIFKIVGFNFQFFPNIYLSFLLLFILFFLLRSAINFHIAILAIAFLLVSFFFLGNISTLIAALSLLYLFILLHNAINLIDGLDGLLAGIVIMSGLAFLVVSFFSGNVLNEVISLVILGVTAGFLVFNFPPASIFMGNNGSYALGFIIIFLAFNSYSIPSISNFAGSLLIIGLPIFNGAFVFLRRLKRGQSPMTGDRHHFFDEIFQKCHSVKKTIFISYVVHGFFVICGLLLMLSTI